MDSFLSLDTICKKVYSLAWRHIMGRVNHSEEEGDLDEPEYAKYLGTMSKGHNTPEEAFTPIPRAHAECYKIDPAWWRTLPMWEWFDIFRLTLGYERTEMMKQNRAARKAATRAKVKNATGDAWDW